MAATWRPLGSHLQPLAATCSHLAATCCSHWSKVSAKWLPSGCKWLQVADRASGCKWLHVADRASGCKWLQLADIWKIKMMHVCSLSVTCVTCLYSRCLMMHQNFSCLVSFGHHEFLGKTGCQVKATVS